jgi:hypothetical protein
VYGSPIICHWRELIVSRILDHNRWPRVPGVHYPDIYREYKQLEEQYNTSLDNKINLALQFLEENKLKQNLYYQNCEHLKEVTQLHQRIDSLKNRLNTEKCDKEILFTSSRLVTTTRAINLERWTYVRTLLEEV